MFPAGAGAGGRGASQVWLLSDTPRPLGLGGRRGLARERQGRTSLPLGVRSGGAVRLGVCGAGKEDGGSWALRTAPASFREFALLTGGTWLGSYGAQISFLSSVEDKFRLLWI